MRQPAGKVRLAEIKHLKIHQSLKTLQIFSHKSVRFGLQDPHAAYERRSSPARAATM